MDENAVQIINQVKIQLSMILGGGMVYDLFVGGYFNARYNDKNSTIGINQFRKYEFMLMRAQYPPTLIAVTRYQARSCKH